MSAGSVVDSSLDSSLELEELDAIEELEELSLSFEEVDELSPSPFELSL